MCRFLRNFMPLHFAIFLARAHLEREFQFYLNWHNFYYYWIFLISFYFEEEEGTMSDVWSVM